MPDLGKGILVVGVVVALMYLATHRGKRNHSAWTVFSTSAEPDHVGVDFNPAWVGTAATGDPVFTGEPELHNTGVTQPGTTGGCKKKGCSCK